MNKTKETPQGFTPEEIMDGSALDSLMHSVADEPMEEEMEEEME